MPISRSSITRDSITRDSITQSGIDLGGVVYADYPFTSDLVDISPAGNTATLTRTTAAWAENDDGTVSTAASGVALYPGSGVRIDPAATNGFKYTENFSTSYWQNLQGTYTQTQADPLGGTNAVKVTATNAAENSYAHIRNFTNALTISLNQTRFVSCYVKTGTAQFIYFQNGDNAGTSGAGQWFDVDAITVESSWTYGSGWSITNARIRQLGSTDWRHIEVEMATSGTVIKSLFGVVNSDGGFFSTVGEYVTFWQGDNKENSSSPIITTTAAVTRNATHVDIDTSGFPVNDLSMELNWTPDNDDNQIMFDMSLDNFDGGALQYQKTSSIVSVRKNLETASKGITMIERNTFNVKGTLDSNGMEIDVDGAIGTDSNTDDLTTVEDPGFVGRAYNDTSVATGQIGNLKVESV